MTRVDELYGRERFLLSPRKIINDVKIQLDGATSHYDPNDPKSREAYESAFDPVLSLPSRAQVYDEKAVNYDKGAST
jgi:hypothetical protein